jgi:hypothetical protein
MKKVLLLTSLAAIVLVAPNLGIAGEDKNENKIEIGDFEKDKKKKKGAEEPKKEEDKFGDLVKKCTKFDGLFTMYRDTVTGKTYIAIREDQLNKEYIYFNHIENAPPGTGYFKGSFGSSKVIRFAKNYEKLDIIQENTSFYFDPNNAISKAADANINEAILASEKIEVTSKEKKTYLIDADAIFLSEKFQLIKMPSSPGGPPGALGSLSASKSRVKRINNYEQNSEVLVDYVYENASPQMFLDAMTDPRNLTITYQHTILEMPKNDFVPRRDDPRIGYFSTQLNDMTSFEATPYRDMIHRWNLVKKDPSATLSEPVEPIVYWIENTTPVEMRPIIKEACERWNIAFEAAGFKNAVVCKEQPDDATWDAGDIRYNVLRWTSSSEPPFGGYGPSFVNPRTGEILGADIMLEWVAISNRVKFDNVFKSSMMLTDEKLEMMRAHQLRNPMFCSAAEMAAQQASFGVTAAQVLRMDQAAEKEIVRQMLYRLVLHEVGHTLGLTHNMRASTMQSVDDIKNVEKIAKEGLCNSVMEYPSFNYQQDPKQQGLYCDVNPGPYDKWVIEYGYSPANDDPYMEEFRLKKITDRSIDKRLAYGNDADDMRSSGRGIDPDVNIYDLSSDPVRYAAERCDLVNSMMPGLVLKFQKNNQSYQELLQSYLVTTSEYGIQLRLMTRWVGGVHYDRSYFGQSTDVKPLTPVEEAKQKQAMDALTKYAFAPNAFDAWNSTSNYLLAQRRGFDHFSENDDPNIHDRILGMQAECLNHLLHPNVLMRIVDSKMYGNTYTLDKVMTDLTNAIFQADAKTAVNTIRQNLQVEYVERLIKMIGEKSTHNNVVKGMVYAELKRISQLEATGVSPDALTKAHRAHIIQLIETALED